MASHEKLQPKQAFITRYGVEPTPLHTDMVVRDMFKAMNSSSLAKEAMVSARMLRRATFRHPGDDLRIYRSRAQARMQRAAALLYPDGPVNGFPANIVGLPTGKRLGKIIDGFLQENETSGLETAFEETIDIVSQVSGEDLSWLKPLIRYTRRELLEQAEAGELQLTEDQINFIRNRGFLTRDEYMELWEEEKARKEKEDKE